MTEQSEAMPHRSNKNTKRWCRGRVGREHTPDIRFNPHLSENTTKCGVPTWTNSFWCWHQRFCTTCGKVLVQHLPKEECPAYA